MTSVTLKERIEEYWNRQPCNIKLSDEPVDSRKWSDELEVRRYRSESHIKRFADFSNWRGKNVLEIGCGSGTDSLLFSRAGAILDAVDLSWESAELTRRRLRMFNYPTRVFSANAEEWLPGGANQYDLIYSFGVLHHTPNPLYVLRRAWPILHPRGEIRVMLYAKRSLKELQRWQPEAQSDCPFIRRYSRGQIYDLFEAAGFVIHQIERRHIFKYKLDDYLKHEYVPRPLLQKLGEKNFNRLARLVGEHFLIYGGRS